jgi:hypothetical protein
VPSFLAILLACGLIAMADYAMMLTEKQLSLASCGMANPAVVAGRRASQKWVGPKLGPMESLASLGR